jgi:hypothetical protein
MKSFVDCHRNSGLIEADFAWQNGGRRGCGDCTTIAGEWEEKKYGEEGLRFSEIELFVLSLQLNQAVHERSWS